MNSPILGLRVASAIFGLVSLGHLARLATRAEVLVAGHPLPPWLSAVGFVLAGGLSVWMWRLAARANRS